MQLLLERSPFVCSSTSRALWFHLQYHPSYHGRVGTMDMCSAGSDTFWFRIATILPTPQSSASRDALAFKLAILLSTARMAFVELVDGFTTSKITRPFISIAGFILPSVTAMPDISRACIPGDTRLRGQGLSFVRNKCECRIRGDLCSCCAAKRRFPNGVLAGVNVCGFK